MDFSGGVKTTALLKATPLTALRLLSTCMNQYSHYAQTTQTHVSFSVRVLPGLKASMLPVSADVNG